jgi:lipid-A-disaccharide synthase
MLIAGEPSGDINAAALVESLRTSPEAKQLAFPARFFGAGGRHMRAAGVQLEFDLASHAVVGLFEVIRKLREFVRMFDRLVALALERRPDVIILVDFGGFNLRFARAIRRAAAERATHFNQWKPRIVYYVSPQVWASRPERARTMAGNVDRLLSIIPFEKEWYGARTPTLPVEFVGNPIVDRLPPTQNRNGDWNHPGGLHPLLLLLPGSRVGELNHHLPVMIETARRVSAQRQVSTRMVLPDDELRSLAHSHIGSDPNIQVQAGGLTASLAEATVAIASTGTVTLECACFGVPTVAMYKTSWSSYQIGKRLATVDCLAMPNLLANETLYPEFIQNAATPANLERETLDLLNNADRRNVLKSKLAGVVASLGPPGASRRAAHAVWDALKQPLQ